MTTITALPPGTTDQRQIVFALNQALERLQVTSGVGNGIQLDVEGPNAVPGYADGEVPLLVQFAGGSAANPIMTPEPLVGISRVDNVSADTSGGENAALYVNTVSKGVHTGGAGTPGQGNGITVKSQQTGSGDCVALYATATTSSTYIDYTAYGIFTATLNNSPSSYSCSLSSILFQNSGSDQAWGASGSGFPLSAVVDAVTLGPNLATAAYSVRPGNTAQFDVGYGVIGNCIKTAAFRDDSSSVAVLQATGSHTNGIDLSGATFSGDAIKLPAWTPFVPTVAPGSGAITTYTSTGRYQKIGKVVAFTMTINITANGTGATSVVASLPVNANSVSICHGRENAVTGAMLQGYISSSAVTAFTYNNAYPGGTGYQLFLSGTYEST